MVTEGMVLGHKISSRRIEVDKAKIEVIKDLPPPLNVKGIWNFLAHAGFNRRFIKDFSKIAKPEIEVFDCGGIDFKGPFPPSCSQEAIAAQKDDDKIVIKFLKMNVFSWFGAPRVLISDGGSHFCNSQLEKVLQHYGVSHKLASPYHLQTNRQAEVSNREIKRILENIVSTTRKDWSLQLDDTLWAYRTTFKAPTGLSLFQPVYGKTCHLHVELEHKAVWALKFFNLDPEAASDQMKLQLQHLEEMMLIAYESSKLYKEKVKLYHDWKLRQKDFRVGQNVMLFNSQMKLFLGKLRTKWSRPFLIKEVISHGAIELQDPTSQRSCVVNGQMVKPYLGGDVERFTTIINLSDT
ncbi:PREDICTED: uncharacterized protein LOC109330821 [Lupinus angustifolius]|uniref:uncharacterized protein LOC109330821 n=1 Tax=Lupinus angustifolius TaxID=3871 RepID=UPI00092E8A9A|nr:PREDICTED: uncharacterized protein LOC109330821 [Lupinus angustifolius]